MLIPDWRQAWRWWSVRLSALGAALMLAAIAAPDALLAAWNSLPDDVRALIPEHVSRAVAFALFAATMVSRIVRQRSDDDGR